MRRTLFLPGKAATSILPLVWIVSALRVRSFDRAAPIPRLPPTIRD